MRKIIKLIVMSFMLASIPIVMLASPKPPMITHQHNGFLPYIDASSIPAPTIGHSEYRVRDTWREPELKGGQGAMRNVCSVSHFNFDDALVHPGKPTASHLHMYFGNTAADAFLTADNILVTGNSTCRGGIANRSAYWIPAVIDTTDGAVIPMSTTDVYYKTGSRGVPNKDINPPPIGFRMIVGDPKRTTEWRSGQVRWMCEGKIERSIPECITGPLRMRLEFPQCWDGLHLYQPDQSHVTRGVSGQGCPSSHPVALMQLSFSMQFRIDEGRNTKNWRLSTDNYKDGPGGHSMHGDWMNGWDPILPPIWTAEILNLGLDGGGSLIGGGKAVH